MEEHTLIALFKPIWCFVRRGFVLYQDPDYNERTGSARRTEDTAQQEQEPRAGGEWTPTASPPPTYAYIKLVWQAGRRAAERAGRVMTEESAATAAILDSDCPLARWLGLACYIIHRRCHSLHTKQLVYSGVAIYNYRLHLQTLFTFQRLVLIT